MATAEVMTANPMSHCRYINRIITIELYCCESLKINFKCESLKINFKNHFFTNYKKARKNTGQNTILSNETINSALII